MSVRILEGDALQVLRTLPDQSVQCCVTSPPYFGLRDYGTGSWEGGDASCDHARKTGTTRGGPNSTLSGGQDIAPHAAQYAGDCEKCGAVRTDRQMGLEKTPALYVDAMVGVFSEVKRVLRDDGTLWLNIGDSYAGSWGNYGGQNRGKGTQRPITRGSAAPNPAYDGLAKYLPATANVAGCKPKDLIGIPWLLAFALRADGWYLRSDIIWAKNNPMPESVTDRPTKSHEYLFLLAKSDRYFYDADAIAEPITESSVLRLAQPSLEEQQGSFRVPGKTNGAMKAVGGSTRNARSVWTVATQPFSEAHFATFPPKLIEPCILAGSAKGQTVLDPFGGAGTTGLVADRLGRDALLIELNPKYAEMARKRIHSDNPLFTDVA